LDLAFVGFAIESAQAFWRTALAVMPRAHDGEPHHNIGEGIPQIVSGAVNLSLAAELSIKAALICIGAKPKRTHNLAKLYDQLPMKAQEFLSAEFDAYLDRNPEDECIFHSLTLSFSPDPQRLIREARDRQQTEKARSTLASVLRNHADTFQLWRYIHEMPESREATYGYDFRQMVCATDILRQFAVQLSEKRGFHLAIGKGTPPDDWGRAG
jgi:hypothetical protein